MSTILAAIMHQPSQSNKMQTLHVNQCCHAPTGKPRFDALVGDRLLIKYQGQLTEVVLTAIPSEGTIVVRLDETDVSLDTEFVIALMLGA